MNYFDYKKYLTICKYVKVFSAIFTELIFNSCAIFLYRNLHFYIRNINDVQHTSADKKKSHQRISPLVELFQFILLPAYFL